MEYNKFFKKFFSSLPTNHYAKRVIVRSMRAAHNEERDTRSFPAKRSNGQYIRIIIYQLNRTRPTYGSAQRTSGNTSGVTYTLYNNQTEFFQKILRSACTRNMHTARMKTRGQQKGVHETTYTLYVYIFPAWSYTLNVYETTYTMYNGVKALGLFFRA